MAEDVKITNPDVLANGWITNFLQDETRKKGLIDSITNEIRAAVPGFDPNSESGKQVMNTVMNDPKTMQTAIVSYNNTLPEGQKVNIPDSNLASFSNNQSLFTNHVGSIMGPLVGDPSATNAQLVAKASEMGVLPVIQASFNRQAGLPVTGVDGSNLTQQLDPEFAKYVANSMRGGIMGMAVTGLNDNEIANAVASQQGPGTMFEAYQKQYQKKNKNKPIFLPKTNTSNNNQQPNTNTGNQQTNLNTGNQQTNTNTGGNNQQTAVNGNGTNPSTTTATPITTPNISAAKVGIINAISNDYVNRADMAGMSAQNKTTFRQTLSSALVLKGMVNANGGKPVTREAFLKAMEGIPGANQDVANQVFNQFSGGQNTNTVQGTMPLDKDLIPAIKAAVNNGTIKPGTANNNNQSVLIAQQTASRGIS